MTLKTTIVRSALTFAALTIMGAMAQAATYHVTLLRPTVISGQEMKPGEYKLEVNNDTAVISRGKQSVETKVKTEATDKKFNNTTVRYHLDGDKYKLLEIGIGGTKTKLVLPDAAGMEAGAL